MTVFYGFIVNTSASSESKRPHNRMMHIVLIMINKCIWNSLDVENSDNYS